tara:strand:+ start:188 stop:505 length:318 start_codon:yes stop_codon:yes gene_type:complete
MTAEEYHDYEEDDGERVVSSLTIEVSHPARWSMTDITDEFVRMGEASEPNSELSVHGVYEQPYEGLEGLPDHPPVDHHDMAELEELEQCRALSDLEDLRHEEYER